MWSISLTSSHIWLEKACWSLRCICWLFLKYCLCVWCVVGTAWSSLFKVITDSWDGLVWHKSVVIAVRTPRGGTPTPRGYIPRRGAGPIWINLGRNWIGWSIAKLILIATRHVVDKRLLLRRELLWYLLNISCKTLVRVKNKPTYSLGSCSLSLGSPPQLRACEPPGLCWIFSYRTCLSLHFSACGRDVSSNCHTS